MDLEVGREVYIIENGLRVSACRIVSLGSGTCVVRFPNGGGCRLRISRLYPTKESAEAAVRYRIVKKPEPAPVRKEYTPRG